MKAPPPQISAKSSILNKVQPGIVTKSKTPEHFIFPATLNTEQTHSGGAAVDDHKLQELSSNIEKLTQTMDQV